MQSQLKVLAPVITRDVSLPNTSKKVPMVIVHVPDSLSLMAIPLATLTSQMTTTTTTTTASATTGPLSAAISVQNSTTPSSPLSAMAREISANDIHGVRLGNSNFISSNNASTKDEQQAKDLLTWNDDGIGTLEGCDLRFKINQLGCLELLDSEDESHPDYHNNNNHQQKQQEKTYHKSKPSAAVHSSSSSSSTTQQRTQATNRTANQQHCQELNQQPQNDHRVSNSSTNSSSSGSTSNSKKSKIKQITPGSSLLRDGPNNWRSRASSSSDTTTTTTTTTTIPQTSNTTRSCTSTPLSRLVEITPNQQTILYEKLIPHSYFKERPTKSKVNEWTIQDVTNFIDYIPGCAGYGQRFRIQQICGSSLLLLELNDLTETIKLEYGPAIKIYNAIALIKDEIQLS